MAVYGSRTGVTTLRNLIKTVCRLNLKYGAAINNWINTEVDVIYRAEALSILASLNTLCSILQNTPDD